MASAAPPVAIFPIAAPDIKELIECLTRRFTEDSTESLINRTRSTIKYIYDEEIADEWETSYEENLKKIVNEVIKSSIQTPLTIQLLDSAVDTILPRVYGDPEIQSIFDGAVKEATAAAAAKAAKSRPRGTIATTAPSSPRSTGASLKKHRRGGAKLYQEIVHPVTLVKYDIGSPEGQDILRKLLQSVGYSS